MRLARCYKSQMKVVSDGLMQVMQSTSIESGVLSSCSLELFINAILLNLLAGKTSVALKYFDQAKLPTEDNPSTTQNFRGTKI